MLTFLNAQIFFDISMRMGFNFKLPDALQQPETVNLSLLSLYTGVNALTAKVFDGWIQKFNKVSLGSNC